MSTTALNDLQSYVESLVKKYEVPAVSLAIWHNNQLHRAADCILNSETGVAATPDAIFQIGSITKVFTTSLIMQLVDEGRVELDRPVKHYLRDFQVADADASNSITVRQLLNHTSGLMGDFFPDESDADSNLIARYVDRCSLLPQIHQPGHYYSYCNSAFAIAGRLVEVVSGISWFSAVEERIFKPLNMNHAVSRPSEVLRYRTAIGHELKSGQPATWQPATACYLPLGLASAGSTLTMSATDLIRIAEMFLNEERSETNDIWLSTDAINNMLQTQIQLPPFSKVYNRYAGLGWAKLSLKSCGTEIIFHNGGTLGQIATLQIIPEQNLAFAALINGNKSGLLEAITEELLAEFADVHIKESEPTTNDDSTELANDTYTGQYRSFDGTYNISLENNKLVAKLTYDFDPTLPENLRLTPIGDNIFATYRENGERLSNIVFLENERIKANLRKEFLFSNCRLSYRVI